MAHRSDADAIISPTLSKEGEVVELSCLKCEEEGKGPQHLRIDINGDYVIRGTMTCIVGQHERPFTMRRQHLQQLDVLLPEAESDKLSTNVPDHCKDDIREAERANYAQCHKSSVVMCRRALQLSLVDKGIPDGPLAAMLHQAQSQGVITGQTFALVVSIKAFGDIGAHKAQIIEPDEARLGIFATVRLLNEIWR